METGKINSNVGFPNGGGSYSPESVTYVKGLEPFVVRDGVEMKVKREFVESGVHKMDVSYTPNSSEVEITI